MNSELQEILRAEIAQRDATFFMKMRHTKQALLDLLGEIERLETTSYEEKESTEKVAEMKAPSSEGRQLDLSRDELVAWCDAYNKIEEEIYTTYQIVCGREYPTKDEPLTPEMLEIGIALEANEWQIRVRVNGCTRWGATLSEALDSIRSFQMIVLKDYKKRESYCE
jgi:hypothetical protein